MEEDNSTVQKSFLIIILIIVIGLISLTSIIAFVTRSAMAKNVITFGSLKMQLLQTTIDENNNEVEVENNKDINITYKSTLSRIVKIKNLGKHDFFARISLNLVGTDTNNQTFDANKFVIYNINNEDWIYKDGWYYYKKIVKQDEITSNLLTEVYFNINDITIEYPNSKVKLDINAEAVQAENNNEKVLEAVGWPSK